MQKKHIVLTILLILTFFKNYAQEDEGIIEKTSLWNNVLNDTFPYLRSYEATNQVANTSLMLLEFSKDRNPEAYQQQFLQTVYYNLLANRLNVVDSLFEIAKNPKYPFVYNNLSGHIALRHILPCITERSEQCDSIIKANMHLLDVAIQNSIIMPPSQWKWLKDYFNDSLKHPKSNIQLQIIQDRINEVIHPSWEGAVACFSTIPGKRNLIISNGPRKPLQALEVDSTGNWIDISSSIGFDTIPGGHLLYVVDYNIDGYDDIMILRKSSTANSPVSFHPLLLKNDGYGCFEEVSAPVGLRSKRRTNCACWSDINQDGLPDVFIGHEYSPSFWLIQNPDGTFENKAYSMNVVTKKKHVTDCYITDFNNDGLDDLLLSYRNDSNEIFIQDKINDEFSVFYPKSSDYNIRDPKVSNMIIPINYGFDSIQEFIIQTDLMSQYDIISDIMNNADTINFEPSLIYIIDKDSTYNTIADASAPLFRSVVIIERIDGIDILAGGGKNTESLYPMFHYQISQQGHLLSISNPEQWPFYVHSMAAFPDNNDQPILVVKGGGAYPFMVNKQIHYSIQMPEKGRFVRIFDIRKVKMGSEITFDYIDPTGIRKTLRKRVQTPDSRGFNALQEWIWTPEGVVIENIQFIPKEIKTPVIQAEQVVKEEKNEPDLNKEDKGSKKKKSKKNKS